MSQVKLYTAVAVSSVGREGVERRGTDFLYRCKSCSLPLSHAPSLERERTIGESNLTNSTFGKYIFLMDAYR